MPRQRTGWLEKRKSDGVWFARIEYILDGKRHEFRRRGRTGAKREAQDLLDHLLRELEDTENRIAEHERATVAELIAFYLQNYATEAKYVDGVKVSGVRALPSIKSHLRAIEARFGHRHIRSITYGDLRSFRGDLLVKPIVFRNKVGEETKKRQRSLANVNRILTTLRRLFRVAVMEGWATGSPFGRGDSLITPGVEKRRERILGPGEEERLLTFCTGLRAHLEPLVICAIDTGMRIGELRLLAFPDLDFDAGTIRALTLKRSRILYRTIAMTARVWEQLHGICERAGWPGRGRVFPSTEIKRAWSTVCHLAGIVDLRFHDLRHTFATRLSAGGMDLAQIARILGHAEPAIKGQLIGSRTTYRYVAGDAAAAAVILNTFNEAAVQAGDAN